MKKLSKIIIITLLGAAFISCDEKEKIVEVPVSSDCAPSPPQEVYSDNRDGYIIIWWAPNPESDISHYNILRSDSLYGNYTDIGSVDVEPGPIPYEYSFEYDQPDNGDQYYYGVTAVDNNGNESYLSFVVTASPRYEGFVRLYETASEPDSSGLDLTGLAENAQPWEEGSTDIYLYDNSGVQQFVTVDSTVNIQDYGYVPSFDFINRAPEEGWAPSGTAEVVLSHCYLIQVLNPSGSANYGKLYVMSRQDSYAELWWAYQDSEENRDLGPAPEYYDLKEKRLVSDSSPYLVDAGFINNQVDH
ncbi:MAG: hypothetical protein GF417_05770 [Candidatus Latescibacteria bacterium]|nr:hypothetical protein [bacterium]MBD3423924.1 hypothetical protein [Candidatus Latescibacterota bacterium]